jgi:HK97 family phage prohead protease
MFNVDSEPLPFIETIAPGAFDRSLSNEANRHTFVMDHDDTKLLASRQAKTLALVPDSRGLLVDSDLPPTSYARDLVALHERGEARSMSFTFRPAKGGETWTGSGGERRRVLSEVRLGHVAVLTGLAPAYQQTTASIRSLAHRLGAEAEELEDAIEAIRDGKPLDARAVDLIEAIVTDLRAEPAEAPIVAEFRGVPIALAQRRLALNAKQAR